MLSLKGEIVRLKNLPPRPQFKPACMKKVPNRALPVWAGASAWLTICILSFDARLGRV
jgi:hypothetical protein